MNIKLSADTCIELLESRIAPASVLLYTDVDGDQVKVKSSKGDLNGKATFADVGIGQQLQILNLTDDSFAGAKIQVIVKRGPSGDGLANIGFINAAGNDLQSVIVKGDLGKIVVGDGDVSKSALKLLRVHSIGMLGTSTQGGSYDGGLPDAVAGSLGELVGAVGGATGGLLPAVQDAVDALLAPANAGNLTDSVLRVLTALDSNLETLLGTLRGDDLPAGATTLLSSVAAALGQLLDLDTDGQIELGATINGLVSETLETVGDVLIALPGLNVSVEVGGGGLPLLNLNLNTLLNGAVGVTLPGLLQIDLGGGLSLGEAMESLGTTLQTILSGAGFDTLPLNLQGRLSEVQALLDGILNNGAPLTEEVIRTLSQLTIELGALLGADGVLPRLIDPTVTGVLTDTLSTVQTILNSGQAAPVDPLFDLSSVFLGNLNKLQVKTDVRDAWLNVQGSLKNARIGGSLDGGVFENGGQLLVTGNLGKLLIGRNLVGGELTNTGLVDVDGKVGAIDIRGALIGGEGVQSGALALASDAKKVLVRKDVVGGDGTLSGSIVNANGEIKTLQIRGSLIAGDRDSSAGVRVHEDIHKLSVKRGIIGDADHRVQITAAGFESQAGNKNFAFKNINIGGSVRHADFLAGYDVSLNPVNGDAGIKSLLVQNNWVASNAVAGVVDSAGLADGFGNATDQIIAGNNSQIIATIAKIQIRGATVGTPEAGDQYGFVAEEIKKLFVNKRKVALSPGGGNDDVQLSQETADLTAREVTAAI